MDSRSSHRMSRWEALSLIFVLSLASVLRLGWPTISQFRLDEAHISSLALTLAEGQSLPLYGTQSSVGVNLPPWGNYLFAIAFAVSSSPLSGVLFAGLLNVAGVVLCWWLARRYWGALSGLVAGLAYAASPWAVFYSRQIWQPDLMAPLALACVTTALLGFVEGRGWATVAHLALLSITLQVHFSGLVLLPISVALMIIYRRRLSWRALLAGCVVALLFAVPYGVYLWRERAAILAIVREATKGGAQFDGQALSCWWMMMTGSGLHSLLGEAAQQAAFVQGPGMRALTVAVLALTVAGSLWGLMMSALGGRGQGVPITMVVTAWWLLPLILFTRHSTPVHMHYMAVSLPAPAVLIGSLLGDCRNKLDAARPYLAAVCTSLGLVEAGVCLAVLGVMGQQATPGGFDYPLDQQLRAVAEAEALGPPYVVLSPGDNATHDEWAAILDVHLRGKPHRLVDGRRAALFMQSGATLIATSGVEAALATYEDSGAVEHLSVVQGREGDAPLLVGRIQAGILPDLERTEGASLLGNGVEVLGYGVKGQLAPGQTITWRLAWRVSSMAFDPAQTYHIFNHLLDADGARVAQMDSSTLPTASWQVGDVVVQTLTLTIPEDVPEGPYRMAVGMYTYPDLETVGVVDPAGNRVSDRVTLGPLQAD